MKEAAIVNVTAIDSVYRCTIESNYVIKTSYPTLDLDFTKEIICVESRGLKWFFNMSVPQFAARIVEAQGELASLYKETTHD